MYLKENGSDGRQFVISTDRAQGGASLHNGELQLMVSVHPDHVLCPTSICRLTAVSFMMTLAVLASPSMSPEPTVLALSSLVR
jgi:hypothetical protein